MDVVSMASQAVAAALASVSGLFAGFLVKAFGPTGNFESIGTGLTLLVAWFQFNKISEFIKTLLLILAILALLPVAASMLSGK